MVPSKIKIESFAKRCHMGTLGGKGLKKSTHSNENIHLSQPYLSHHEPLLCGTHIIKTFNNILKSPCGKL